MQNTIESQQKYEYYRYGTVENFIEAAGDRHKECFNQAQKERLRDCVCAKFHR